MKHTIRLLKKEKEQYLIYAKNNLDLGDYKLAWIQLGIVGELDGAIKILSK